MISEIWSHSRAAALKSRNLYTTASTVRARRLNGRPWLNFVRLVVHGLRARSVFSDIVGVRVLVSILVLILLVLAGLAMTRSVRLLTNLVIAGWATNLVGILSLTLPTVVNVRGHVQLRNPQRAPGHVMLLFFSLEKSVSPSGARNGLGSDDLSDV